MQLSNGVMNNFEVLYSKDENQVLTKGKFPCGRESSPLEGKEVQLPKNFSCDSCVIKLQFDTKSSGTLNYCSDIEILSGKIEDCSGQCVNGGMCMNGNCQCRKGYQGKFCEIVEYVPVQTNYTLYLKYFLFFIVMLLAIVALLAGAYLLFQNASKIRDMMSNLVPQRRVEEEQDEDALIGTGLPGGESAFGQNRDIIQ